jgi:hypothetical protein
MMSIWTEYWSSGAVLCVYSKKTPLEGSFF